MFSILRLDDIERGNQDGSRSCCARPATAGINAKHNKPDDAGINVNGKRPD